MWISEHAIKEVRTHSTGIRLRGDMQPTADVSLSVAPDVLVTLQTEA